MVRALLDRNGPRVAVLGLHPRLGPRVGDDGDADVRPPGPARAVAQDGAGTRTRRRGGLDPADAAGSGVEQVRVGGGGEWRVLRMERRVLRAAQGVAGVSVEDAVLGAAGG